MRNTFKVKVFVETGTHQAETAVWASANFERVFTVEAQEPLHQKAVETFGSRKNIRFLKGDSRMHIKSLTSSLTEPAIFWLDAHWCGENTFGKSDECPVVGELELLNASKVPHIVLIDDARLFLAPPPAPHEATHWPDISAICRLMAAHDSHRYVAVHDDAIIGVPGAARLQLVEFLRAESVKDTSPPAPSTKPARRTLPFGVVNVKTTAKRLLKAPFRALGMDLVRWHPPKPQPVIPLEELEMIASFSPQYKPEEHWFVNSGIKTVLDVGAHTGEFARRIRAILPHAELICFEPLQEPYSKLTQQFEGQPNFRAVRYALGDKEGQCEIYHNEYAPSSSLLPMAELHKQSFTFAVKEKNEMVEVRRLSDVVRELDVRDPLLLKLDVQGFEDKVIAGGEDVVARAKIIIIEVSFQPLYEGGPLFDDIYRLLKENGFTYNGNFEQLFSPKDGRILQADAIFCR
jgi:FkbM family methyltransferase